MIKHKNKHKKPFQIGQLLFHKRQNDIEHLRGPFRVLDIEWFFDKSFWGVFTVHHQSGKMVWYFSDVFRPIEENDDQT